MTKRLASVAPLQCGIVLAVLYGLLALVFVPFLLLVAILAPHDGVNSGLPVGGGTAVMVVLAVVLPIMYAFFGFIGGFIAAAIYNLVAGWTGGLELTFVDVPPAIPSQGKLPTTY